MVYLFLLVSLKVQVVFKGAANKPSLSLFVGSAVPHPLRRVKVYRRARWRACSRRRSSSCLFFLPRFPLACSALFLHYCPKSQRNTNMNRLKGSKCCKTDGKRAFYGLSLLMLSTRAAPFAFRLRRCQGSVLRFAAPIMARCHPSATLTRARWRGNPQKGRERIKRRRFACSASLPASLSASLSASLPASWRSQGKRNLHRIRYHKAQGKARFQSSARLY